MHYARVEVDGRPATTDRLAPAALVNYGHYTMLQIRDRRVRGLDLHLARLDAATRELFGVGLDDDRVRHQLRHALDDAADATGRITVFDAGEDEPAVMVAVGGPTQPSGRPQRLQTVRYQRPMAHLKHVGSFGQIHFGRRAGREGFDDALLTGDDGTISETAIANVAFVDGDGIVWPDAPALAGITMRLLEPLLASRRQPVRVAELPSLGGAFVTNTIGIAPVDRVDGLTLPVREDLMRQVDEAYASVPWDPI